MSGLAALSEALSPTLLFRLRPQYTKDGVWLLDVFIGPKGRRQLSGTIRLRGGDEYLALMPNLRLAGEVEEP